MATTAMASISRTGPAIRAAQYHDHSHELRLLIEPRLNRLVLI